MGELLHLSSFSLNFIIIFMTAPQMLNSVIKLNICRQKAPISTTFVNIS
jgi:hypothetical protein